MRAVIICGGEIGDAKRAKKEIRTTDMIICADSGYKYVSALEIKPDVVLGDFDSCHKEQVICDNVMTYPVKKDFTDSEIAADYAVSNGADEIVFLGATGGRADHFLANVYLLKNLRQQGVNAMIYDTMSKIYYVEESISIDGNAGDILSVIPFSGVDDITTEGLEYALCHEPLPRTGVSNVFLGEKAQVHIGTGGAIVIYMPKEFV